jgi:hypothetical protein
VGAVPSRLRSDVGGTTTTALGVENVREYRQNKGLLFVTYDLGQSLQNTQQRMREEIEGFDSNRLLNTPLPILWSILSRNTNRTDFLLKESWYADTKEIQVDVRHDPMRWIDDKSKTDPVAGERTEVRIPFEANPSYFTSHFKTRST